MFKQIETPSQPVNCAPVQEIPIKYWSKHATTSPVNSMPHEGDPTNRDVGLVVIP